MSTVAKNI